MISNKTCLASIALLCMALVFVGFSTVRPEPVIINMNLEQLPMVIGDYRGTNISFPEAVYKELNADKHVYRQYRNGTDDSIYFYLGYYGTAKGGRSEHNPLACLPGAGWAIIDLQKVELRQSIPSNVVDVNYVHATRDGINSIMLHWYQISGVKVLSSGFQQNVERFLGRILHNRNDGAFVQITIQVPDSRMDVGLEEIRAFAENIMKLLPDYWPIEK